MLSTERARRLAGLTGAGLKIVEGNRPGVHNCNWEMVQSLIELAGLIWIRCDFKSKASWPSMAFLNADDGEAG